MSLLRSVDASMRTDTGRVRDHNEDFVASLEPNNPDEEAKNGWLYIVADGVGGAEAGEVASKFATEQVLKHYLENEEERDLGQRLLASLHAANTDLRQLLAEREQNKRMATTMVAVVIHGSQAHIANVGDSRGYHWRQGELKQVTKDQSLVAKLLEEGAISEEEAEHHPHRNVILYSIGSENVPKIDLFGLELEPDDRLILCSDGLIRHVSDSEINEVVGSEDLETSTETLIALANERGGQDNISVGVINFNSPTAEETASSEEALAEQDELDEEEATARIVPQPMPAAGERQGRRFLWGYTIFLSIVEVVLIFAVWLLLQF